jgi:serine/threonine protein kinase
MGNELSAESSNVHAETASVDKEREGIGTKDFKVECYLGRGSFGHVWKVRELFGQRRSLAAKVMQKRAIVEQRMVEHVRTEYDVLASVGQNCRYVTSLEHAWVTPSCVVFVMELAAGGSLFALLRQRRDNSNSRQQVQDSRREADDQVQVENEVEKDDDQIRVEKEEKEEKEVEKDDNQIQVDDPTDGAADADDEVSTVGMPESEIKAMTAEIVVALRAMHQAGFMYRDLKLESMFALQRNVGSAHTNRRRRPIH